MVPVGALSLSPQSRKHWTALTAPLMVHPSSTGHIIDVYQVSMEDGNETVGQAPCKASSVTGRLWTPADQQCVMSAADRVSLCKTVTCNCRVHQGSIVAAGIKRKLWPPGSMRVFLPGCSSACAYRERVCLHGTAGQEVREPGVVILAAWWRPTDHAGQACMYVRPNKSACRSFAAMHLRVRPRQPAPSPSCVSLFVCLFFDIGNQATYSSATKTGSWFTHLARPRDLLSGAPDIVEATCRRLHDDAKLNANLRFHMVAGMLELEATLRHITYRPRGIANCRSFGVVQRRCRPWSTRKMVQDVQRGTCKRHGSVAGNDLRRGTALVAILRSVTQLRGSSLHQHPASL
jgi:hypothetical protein